MDGQAPRLERLDRIATILLGGIVSTCALTIAVRISSFAEIFFWDYRVYAGAMQAFAAGQDGYQRGVIQTFGVPPAYNYTSPPAVLYLMQGLEWSLGPTALLALFAVLFVAALGAAILLQLRLFNPECRNAQLTGDMVAAFAAFNIAGLVATLSGNVGVLLNSAVVVGVTYAVRTGRWAPFFVALALCAAVKPFYLEFLALPLFIESARPRRLLGAAASIAATAAIYAVSWALDPVRFGAWRASLAEQSFGRGDMGENLFAFLLVDSGAHDGVMTAAAVQVLFAAGLLALVLTGLPKPGARRLAGLWIAACFANPRLMMYDLALVSLPANALLASWAARRFALSRYAAGALCCAGLFAVALLSSIVLVVPRSLTFPLLGLLAIGVAVLDERRSDLA